MKNGFSLIECLLVLAIAAIVALMAVPGLKAQMQRNKSDLIAEKLIASLTNAVATAQSQHEVLRMQVGEHGWQLLSGNKILIDEKIRYKLNCRSFPRGRKVLYFSPKSYVHSNNAMFWLCIDNKIRWAVSISKMAAIKKRLPNRDGNISDENGRVLSC